MKKGFTLVELLIVVVVIVTLMAVSFRLARAGTDITELATTVSRIQKLENCLSGYYAAYGSYPPVAVHGSRDYRYPVNSTGIQRLDENPQDKLFWPNVRAACRSQPIGFACPFPPNAEPAVKRFAEVNGQKFVALVDDTWIRGHGKVKEIEWANVQVFKLGMMSYLLPRLLVLSDPIFKKSSNGRFNDNFFALLDCSQWNANNDKPSDFASGQTYGSWKIAGNDGLFEKDNRWKLALQPSQAVCARWIANLSDIVAGTPLHYSLYGVNIINGSDDSIVLGRPSDNDYELDGFYIYSANGAQGAEPDSVGEEYVLREVTVKDGWGRELYYYSPPPYQSYTLWSSGPNEKTFPPWIADEELEKLDKDDRDTAREWMVDDIVHMKN